MVYQTLFVGSKVVTPCHLVTCHGIKGFNSCCSILYMIVPVYKNSVLIWLNNEPESPR